MEITEKISSDIREFISHGKSPKTAIAMALAKSRKESLAGAAPEEKTSDDEALAGALAAEAPLTEAVEEPTSEVESILAASGISEAAKAAILAKKQNRVFKQSR